MIKRVFFLFLSIALSMALFAPCAALDGEVVRQKEKSVLLQIFDISDSPVLLKYVAEENNCSVISDPQSKTVAIFDEDDALLKTYENLMFINGQPVIDAGSLQSDLGWTVCAHAPNSDIFQNETDAFVAGAFTYIENLENSGFTYYVGRCYDGWYFSNAEGEHEKKHPHLFNQSMMNEFAIRLQGGDLYCDIGEIAYGESAAVTEPVFENRPDENLHPVLLEYILSKNGYTHTYDEEDGKVYVSDKNGELITSFKNVPLLYGSLMVESSVLGRAGFEYSAHEPDEDLFDTELDAITAAWLSCYHESQNREFKFYIGNCYGGYYFSLTPGFHEKNCDHTLNKSMFYEFEVVIENGAIVFDDIAIRDMNSPEFARYKKEYGDVFEDKPAGSLTKMVTVIHTEYAKKEGAQTAYFSYRDRVYRNYWEDVANYDVTDYIFIPPAFPIADNYAEFNVNAANDLSNAVLSLLEYNSGAKIWLGSPGITSENYRHNAITVESSADFFDKVKGRLGKDIWQRNIEGVYVNQESIYPGEEKIQLERIKAMVNYFKRIAKSKKSLWIPYFDLDADSTAASMKIAEVTRIPDLFDYIIIQPGYFFFERVDGVPSPDTTSHRRQNIDAVMNSSLRNFVSSAQGKPVDTTTTTAAIGFEMEPQASYFSKNSETRDESLDRYTQYLLAGAKIKDISPVAFYTSGDPHCNKEALVYKFYGAEELGAKAVRKKLDYHLNEFYDYVFETREKEKVFFEYAKALYLAASPQNTEQGFEKAYTAAEIIPEFYKYERRMNIDDLTEYIIEGRPLSDSFDKLILTVLSAY